MSAALSEYKTFIDGLVELARRQGASQVRLRDGMSFYPNPSREDQKYNDFVTSLNQEQRELLAELLRREREVGIFDMLAFMYWKEYRLSRDGVELPVDPFDAESYYDLTCRLAGDTWPDERAVGEPSAVSDKQTTEQES